MPLGAGHKKENLNSNTETTRHAGLLFTEEDVASITGFFDVLRRIHTHLAVEGYDIGPAHIREPATRLVEGEETPDASITTT